MGLFSSKTKIYVASTAYNLAGDEDLRPNILRSVILGGVLKGGKEGFGYHLQRSIMNGPGSRVRRFHSWAAKNYTLGMPSATMGVDTPVSAEVAISGLKPLLSLGPNEHLWPLSALVDDADIHYWAERWVLENHPGLDDDLWAAEWDMVTLKIKIFVGDDQVAELTAPEDLLWGATNEGRKLLYILYKIVTQDPETMEVTESEPRLFTYRMGSGNVVFDTLVKTRSKEPEFFPAIPLRKKKRSIRHSSHSSDYPMVSKAFKKLTGGKITELLDQIEENKQIGNVDSAYLVLGVSLNTKENAGREYIYRFMRRLMEKQFPYQQEIPLESSTLAKPTAASAMESARWLAVHQSYNTANPVFYSVLPPITSIFNQSRKFELRTHSPGLSQADFRLEWQHIEETVHVGNAKTFDGNTTRGHAKVGEYWFAKGPDRELWRWVGGKAFGKERYPQIYLFHQFSKRRYRRLACIGMVHRNFIYGGHAASVTAKKALSDSEESEFIVPLHMPTLRDMGLVKVNQLSTCSAYLVFNSYKKVKVRWYQRGFFKFVFAIAAVALSMFTAGASLATMGGVLGVNATVGAALGASAATAAVVGAIANTIAGMIVATLISKTSTKLFGEKIGAIIGTIASFVAITYATQFAMHGNFAVDWGRMIRVDNLIELTNSVSNAYTQWVNADTAEIYDKINDLEATYTDEMKKIQELSKEILGMTAGEIDPMMFIDASEYFGENSDAFLSRTLLTGSEIAELAFAMVENFADISLELPRTSHLA